MLQLIEFFQSKGYKLIFGTAAQKTENALDLEILGVEVVELKLNNAAFNEYLAGLAPDIVLFDRFITEEQFGWRVSEVLPAAIRILDTEDLHCLRKVREKQYKAGRLFHYSDLLTEEISKREIAAILRCDLSLMISKVEIQILREVFHIDSQLLLYLPFLLPKGSDTNLPGYDERQHFISIGNFLHAPNLEAVKILKQTIWPEIRKQLPQAELHVYGAYPNQQVKNFHNRKEGFLVKGFVENQREVLQAAKVLLAPLTFGAGLKGKFIDAMQNGCPSVTTTIGIEGYADIDNWGGSVANEWSDFIEKSVSLYSDQNKWEDAKQKGFILLQDFDKEPFEEEFSKTLDYLFDKLSAHRKNNFIGSLLQYHTLKSTKYLSKWIEEKNK